MTTFTAGRFKAVCFLGVQNGQETILTELHINGSGEEIGRLRVRFDDLQDIEYVLKRAIEAHRALKS